jgi:hypothetical protein
MKLLISLVLALTSYVIVGATLALAAQAIWPGALPEAGRRPEDLRLLLADLGVQGLACVIAGACAMSPAGLRLRTALVGVGGPVLAVTLVMTLAAWSSMPDWYDVGVLVLTFPFFALGAAWRVALRTAATTTSYRAP